MHVGEYLLALVGIVLGLAVADLGISTHRLIRRRADVRFAIVPILTAVIAFYLVLLNFWGDYSILRAVTQVSLWSILPNLLVLFLTFLIAASALPDEWEGKLDLWQYYLGARRQFWMLVALAGIAANMYDAARHWPPRPADYVSVIVTVAFAGPLWLSERRWVHLVLVSIFLAMIVFMAGDLVISG